MAILDLADAAPDTAAAQRHYDEIVARLDVWLEPNESHRSFCPHAWDVAYPIVAFADESAMRASPACAAYFGAHPLQVRYFQEHAAGDNFFVRLAALPLGQAPVAVLRAYYLALALGFEGRFAAAGAGDGIAALLADLHGALRRRDAFDASLWHSPSGFAPRPGAADGLDGRDALPPADAYAAWTKRRAWRAFGGLSAAAGIWFVLARWYLQQAWAPTLQHITTRFGG